MIDIAVIGGSGLYKLEGIKNVKEITVKTPFGSPSDKIITGTVDGVKIGFLPRHNRGHIFLPSEIPYRANIYALKKLGAKAVLAFSAAGSLKENLPPGTFVFPDQIFDKTSGRVATFLGGGVMAHISFADPFCECLQKTLFAQARKMKIKASKGGTVVCIEGPAFSTRAESVFHKKMGWSLVGMTVATEAKLAREAGLAYGHCAVVTDFDCWKKEDHVSSAKINAVVARTESVTKQLLLRVAPLAAKLARCGNCNASVYGAATAPHKKVNKAQLKKIELILK